MNKLLHDYYLYVLNKVRHGRPHILQVDGKLLIRCQTRVGCKENCIGYTTCLRLQPSSSFPPGKREKEDRIVRELIRLKIIPYILHVRFKSEEGRE